MTSVIAGFLFMTAFGLIVFGTIEAVRAACNRSIWLAEMAWRRHKGRPVVSFDRYMHPRRPAPPTPSPTRHPPGSPGGSPTTRQPIPGSARSPRRATPPPDVLALPFDLHG